MITILASASSTSTEEFGISGSVLVGLAGSISDIDIIIYGCERSQRIRKVFATLLREDNDFKAYGEEKLRKLHESRHGETGIFFEDYARCEARKDFQGCFKGTDFFVRYVKDVHEVNEEYGSISYRALGHSRLKATVTSDDDAIFTPCTYQIKDTHISTTDAMPPKEIVSFRGQFCEQARVGEIVVAQGKVEQLSERNRTWNRLLLGSTRTDFMIAYPSGCGDG
jgi:predicted nucleotidyltransferase